MNMSTQTTSIDKYPYLRQTTVVGRPIPQCFVDKIVELVEEKEDYEFSIAYGLERKTRFFKDYPYAMVLYDRFGNEFTYSPDARPIYKNEDFMGVAYFPNKKIAKVYFRFK